MTNHRFIFACKVCQSSPHLSKTATGWRLVQSQHTGLWHIYWSSPREVLLRAPSPLFSCFSSPLPPGGEGGSKSPGKFYEASSWMSWINYRLLASLQIKKFLLQLKTALPIAGSLGAAGGLITMLDSLLKYWGFQS